MLSRITRFAVALLAAVLVIAGVPTAASAEPTANYKYTCSTPGQADWSIPKGTRLSTCTNGYIHVRLNGKLVTSIPTNASGLRSVPQVVSAKKVWCVVGVVGTGMAVITTTGIAGWISVGLGGASTIATCKA